MPPVRRTVAVLLAVAAALPGAAGAAILRGASALPSVTIATAPPASTTATTATIAFTTLRATSVRCSLDGAAATDCASPATVSGLAAGTHVFTVTASSRKGSDTARASWTVQAPAPAPAPSPTPVPVAKPTYALRGVYQFGTLDLNASVAAGLDAFKVSADDYALLSTLSSKGLHAWAEPGFYVKSTCSFSWSDAQVRSVLPVIATNPAVAGYYISDEPDVTTCPSAPQQLAARTALIHSLVPGSETVIANWHQLDSFAHSADAFALDMYPCSISWYGGCALHYVSDIAHTADSLGLKYYGVVQGFGDPWGFTMPTADQLHQVFQAWRATNMKGYFVFAWDWPSSDPSYWLINHSDVLAQLKLENAQ
jgi:hypothetical protein